MIYESFQSWFIFGNLSTLWSFVWIVNNQVSSLAPKRPGSSFQSKRVTYWYSTNKSSSSSCWIRIADISQHQWNVNVSSSRSAKCNPLLRIPIETNIFMDMFAVRMAALSSNQKMESHFSAKFFIWTAIHSTKFKSGYWECARNYQLIQRCIQVFKFGGPLDPFLKNLGVHCKILGVQLINIQELIYCLLIAAAVPNEYVLKMINLFETVVPVDSSIKMHGLSKLHLSHWKRFEESNPYAVGTVGSSW